MKKFKYDEYHNLLLNIIKAAIAYHLFYLKNLCSLNAFFQAFVFFSNTYYLQSPCIQYIS